jgi:hypothetical protein
MPIAALTMNKDIGLSAYVFGLGAGAFFWGYFLLEVPSNLILEKVGARRWIGRIMISWGLVSAAFVFTQGPISFIVQIYEIRRIIRKLVIVPKSVSVSARARLRSRRSVLA